MKRKVIQLAGKTYVVSLPLSWAKENKIKKGDELEITQGANHLSIAVPSLQLEDSSISIHVKKDEELTKRELADLYIRGYDHVKIYTTRKNIEDLKHEKPLGFEIVDEGKDFVEYKNFSEGNDFDVILRRTFLIIKEMSLLEDKKTILSLEETTNTLTTYCKRVLNKRGYTPSHKIMFLYAIVRELEIIADMYKYIALECEVKKVSEDYFREISEFFSMFYEFFYSNKAVLYPLKKVKNQLLKKGRELLKKDPLSVHYGMSIVLSIYNLCGPYTTMQASEIYSMQKHNT